MDSYAVVQCESGGFIVEVSYGWDDRTASYTLTEAEALDWTVRQKQMESSGQSKS